MDIIGYTNYSSPMTDEELYRRIEKLTANDTIDDTLDVDLFQADLFLSCEFHLVAMYIWAVGITAL